MFSQSNYIPHSIVISHQVLHNAPIPLQEGTCSIVIALYLPKNGYFVLLNKYGEPQFSFGFVFLLKNR